MAKIITYLVGMNIELPLNIYLLLLGDLYLHKTESIQLCGIKLPESFSTYVS